MTKLFILLIGMFCSITAVFSEPRNPFAVINLPECRFDQNWQITGMIKYAQQHSIIMKYGLSEEIISLSEGQYLTNNIWQLKQVKNQQVIFERSSIQGCPEGLKIMDIRSE